VSGHGPENELALGLRGIALYSPIFFCHSSTPPCLGFRV
jgi:hypothetical protein